MFKMLVDISKNKWYITSVAIYLLTMVGFGLSACNPEIAALRGNSAVIVALAIALPIAFSGVVIIVQMVKIVISLANEIRSFMVFVLSISIILIPVYMLLQVSHVCRAGG